MGVSPTVPELGGVTVENTASSTCRKDAWKSGVLSVGILGLAHAAIEQPMCTPVGAAVAQTQVNGRAFSENFMDLYKRRALYRSLPSALVGSVPKSITHYFFFSCFSDVFLAGGDIAKASAAQAAYTGVATGVAEAFVATPLNFVRARMQRPEWGYTSTAGCVRAVVQKEGVTAFYKGLGPTLLRNPLCNGVTWYTLKSLDNSLPEFSGRWFVCGAVGGVFGSLVSYPFELARVLQSHNIPLASFSPSSVGFLRMFRGWAPGATHLTFSSALMALIAPNLRPLRDFLEGV